MSVQKYFTPVIAFNSPTKTSPLIIRMQERVIQNVRSMRLLCLCRHALLLYLHLIVPPKLMASINHQDARKGHTKCPLSSDSIAEGDADLRFFDSGSPKLCLSFATTGLGPISYTTTPVIIKQKLM
jgi:hypothetical protein